MPIIPPEVIEKAKQMDLLTYLKNFEPEELVKFSETTYSTKTHDSLKISNGKWMWWSQGIGGTNALSYLIKVKGVPYIKAVEQIMGSSSVIPFTYENMKPIPQKDLLLPTKSPNNNIVVKYLFGRGIDYGIISDCIKEGIIFESLPYHNAIFIGKDDEGIPRYAAYRATSSSRILGDASGSDKHYSFRLNGTDDTKVHFFECAIDVLSYATLLKLSGITWKDKNLVSLAGVYSPKQNIEETKIPSAVENFLNSHKNIKKIFLHFDNDPIGRKASEALKQKLSDKYEVVDSPPPFGKDCNDFLLYKLNFNKQNERKVKTYDR